MVFLVLEIALDRGHKHYEILKDKRQVNQSIIG